jgi:hypothetical protein
MSIDDAPSHNVMHKQNKSLLIQHVSGLIGGGGPGEDYNSMPKSTTPNLNHSISNFVNDFIRESPSPNETTVFSQTASQPQTNRGGFNHQGRIIVGSRQRQTSQLGTANNNSAVSTPGGSGGPLSNFTAGGNS